MVLGALVYDVLTQQKVIFGAFEFFYVSFFFFWTGRRNMEKEARDLLKKILQHSRRDYEVFLGGSWERSFGRFMKVYVSFEHFDGDECRQLPVPVWCFFDKSHLCFLRILCAYWYMIHIDFYLAHNENKNIEGASEAAEWAFNEDPWPWSSSRTCRPSVLLFPIHVEHTPHIKSSDLPCISDLLKFGGNGLAGLSFLMVYNEYSYRMIAVRALRNWMKCFSWLVSVS